MLLLGVAAFVVMSVTDPLPENREIDGPLTFLLWVGLALAVLGLGGLIEWNGRRLVAGDKGIEHLRNLTATLDRASAAITALKREILERSYRLETLKKDVESIETISKMSPEQLEHVLRAAEKSAISRA